MRNSQDKSIKNRLTSHKSQVSVKGDIDNYEQKPPKPSKLSRKEQRASREQGLDYLIFQMKK